MVNPIAFKAGAVAFLAGGQYRSTVKPDFLGRPKNLSPASFSVYQDNACQSPMASVRNRNVRLFDSQTGFNLADEDASPKEIDSILIDIATLSSVPDETIDSLKPLEKQGLYIKQYKGTENYGLKTPDGNFFELRTLAKLDQKGFRSRSVAVHSLDKDGNISDKPESVGIAFSGTVTWADMQRTATMFLTKMPLQNCKLIDELLYQTSKKYKETYLEDLSSTKINVSAHSAGATHALHAYEKLNNDGIKSNLRLYEPYGAKFLWGASRDHKHKDTISYKAQNSFLGLMGWDGKTLGYTEILPPSSDKAICGGQIMGSINDHKLVCMAGAAINKEMNKAKTDNLIIDVTNSSKNTTREDGLTR